MHCGQQAPSRVCGSVRSAPLVDGTTSKEMTPAAWAPHKLDRIEDLQWDPPELSFITERHGAMVVGESSREEIQSWTVNLDALTAMASICGFRQKTPAQPWLNIAPSFRSRHSVPSSRFSRASRICCTVASIISNHFGPRVTNGSSRSPFFMPLPTPSYSLPDGVRCL